MVLPHALANVPKGCQGLPVRVQRFTGTAPEQAPAQGALDDKGLVLLGNRRERQDLPVTLLENMANQIVLVQPLHDDDDAALGLVVEAANQTVVVPLIGGIPP